LSFFRAKELSELSQIHEEAKKEKESKEKSKLDRKTALQNRLKKVRDKKRLKMGLPMLDLDDDYEEEKLPEVKKEEEEESPEDSVLKALKDIREKEEEAKRKQVVREWDVGKEEETVLTMKPAEKKVLSQQEWVKTKRTERPKEFAPPVNLYQQDKKSEESSNPFRSSKPVKTTIRKQSERLQEFAPPASLYHQEAAESSDGYPNSYTFRTANPVKPQFQAPLPVRTQQSSFDPTKYRPPLPLHPQGPPPKIRPQTNYNNPPPPGFHQVDFSNDAGTTQPKSKSYLHNSYEESKWEEPQEKLNLPSTSMSTTSRLEMHRQMNEGLFEMSKPIVNELEEEEYFEPVVEQNLAAKKSGGKSVEIPPPCDMEYYASTSSDNKRSNWKGMRTR